MMEYNIYPKQFRSLHIPVEKNRCFFLMPFSKNFDYIYGMLKKELHETGFVCNRADEIAGSTPILNKILTEILRAQYIIVDLSEGNPNVFYELGIAHTFKDAHEILLLKQRTSKVPFDISHLTYIEYDADNIKFLIANILRFINESKPIVDLYDVLNLRGIIHGINANQNEFVEYLHNYLNSELRGIIALLTHKITEITEKDVERILSKYQDIIIELIHKKNTDILPDVLKTYYELVAASAEYTVSEAFINSFLNDMFISFNLSKSDILSWQTDFVLVLAKNRKKLDVAIHWIIEYFSRTKSGTIDINRYKLESFLMTTTISEIDNAVISSIYSNNCYIREHMADIIGEKKLLQAAPNLFKQLEIEDNFFTASSMITAIGKLGKPEGIHYINRWLSMRENEIFQTKQFFVLRRALMAISQLDMPEYLEAFNNKYGETIKNYFII